ncbi:MAG: FtsW/RodA/SpoVE family cell cycle protein [Faecalimonas umbilicata]|uniref:FtsW/RodA/SpoVE family cell cycle protein n=1 Tax=Faecalimonas umbilicata TaxID=1912855 RepID=UPI0039A378ED
MKFLKRYHLKNFNFILVTFVTALSIIGIMAVGSAQKSMQGKQIFGVILGLLVMLLFSVIDYKWILRFYWILYAVNLILLLLVHFFGAEANNAVRWLDFEFIRFQPSDPTKILMILFFAQFLTKHRKKLNHPVMIMEAIALILPSLYLIYKQPNLSTTICLAALFCVLLYLGGLSYKFIGTVLAVVIPVCLIFLSLVVHSNVPFLKDYQRQRILAWLEPQKYASSTAYQQMNSIMAIGSGQLKGKGYDNNTTTSVKNGNFISEPQTDFIFAIIGEELGFIGCCIVIILLLLIIVQCIIIGLRAQDLAGQIICGGVAALIGIQSFINISVATGIFPNTGISLPFVSYGLSSIVSLFSGIGVVLNVGLQPKKYQ